MANVHLANVLFPGHAVVEVVVSRGSCTFGSPAVPSLWAVVAHKAHAYYTSYTRDKVADLLHGATALIAARTD